MAKRMTYEEKKQRQQAAEQARLEREAAEFRKTFERLQARRVYSDQLAYEIHEATGDRVPYALGSLVDHVKRVRRQLATCMARAVRDLQDAQARMDAGRDPAWHSQGILGQDGLEVDALAHELKTQVQAVATMAHATGYRVREIETRTEQAKWDALQNVVITQIADGWILENTGDDTVQATVYQNEVLALSALHVLVHGRGL